MRIEPSHQVTEGRTGNGEAAMPCRENPISAMFRDRYAAGFALARKLAGAMFGMPIGCPIPNGGVPVATGIVEHLGWDLRPVVVSRIKSLQQPQLSIGAFAGHGY